MSNRRKDKLQKAAKLRHARVAKGVRSEGRSDHGQVSNAFGMTGYEIFDPFMSLNKNSPVFISTWGLGTIEQMAPIVKQINSKTAIVQLLVGYSKTSHNMEQLFQTLSSYKSMGWHVKVLPSYHAKVWLMNKEAWVGSANFVKGTITNLMVKTSRHQVQNFVQLNWQQGTEISWSTKLELVPQAKLKII